MLPPTGTPQFIRNFNESIVIDILVKQGQLSRADISRMTGLSKPTVSSTILNLMERSLLREVGRGENNQGRKATLVEFNAEAYYTFGVDLEASQIRIALADLYGTIVAYRQLAMTADSPELILYHIYQVIEEMMAVKRIGWDQIKCLGLAVPAVVIPETGSIRMIVRRLEGFEEAFSLSSVSEQFPCEVLIENDVNLAAVAEHEYGVARGAALFVFISIGVGIGAGIMVNSQLLRGMQGGAGEIAEMRLQQGERLEDMVGADGLVALASRILAECDSDDTRFREYTAELTPEAIFDAARSGDKIALQIIEAYCELIASAIHNLYSIIAPEIIVLGGGIGGNGDIVIPTLQAILAEKFSTKPKLLVSALENKAAVRGAVHLAVNRTFEHIRSDYSK